MEKEIEKNLIHLMSQVPNKGAAVILLESIVQKYGPVSNKAGDEIKTILKELPE